MPDDTAAPEPPVESGGMLDGPAAMDSFYWLTAGGQSPLPPRSTLEEQARDAARAGDALLARGHVGAALERYREAVRLEPRNYEHHFRLAQAANPASEAALAEPHFLETVRLNPRHVAAHVALANIYRQSERIEPALRHSETALVLAPQDSQAILARALTLSAAGQTADAWTLIEPLIAEGSTDPWIARLYARLAPAIGHERRASVILEWLLWLADVPKELKAPLHYQAAALLDRLGHYDEAFEQAKLGNELLRRPHDAAAHSAYVSSKINYFTRRGLQSLARATHGDARPLFIVGMPRSGTSLLEEILASHPAVHARGELETLRRLESSLTEAGKAQGEAYPQCLESVSTQQADELASRYLSALHGAAARSARYVTDRMPANTLCLELVELLFPESRVIHCVRDPLDTGLSCYMSEFVTGNSFAFDLRDAGAYHRDHRRLMEHWKSVLSVPVLDVRYEDLVLDTEAQVRRVLDFLELRWDARCLAYDGSEGPRKARRPIYTTSIGRWKRYEKHLGPLFSGLAGQG